MKKCVFTFVLLLTILSLNAQIKREAYGIALGASRDEVMATLEAKELYVNEEPIEYGELLVGYGNIYFAGIQWQSVVVMVTEGKVSSIVFNYASYDMDTAEETCANLLDNLNKKYAKYAEQTPQTSETFTTKTIAASYVDQQTGVDLDGELLLIGTSTMMLMYYDVNGVNQLQQQVYDEL